MQKKQRQYKNRRCRNSGAIISALTILLCFLVSSCVSSRYVEEGKYLLDKVKINICDSTTTVTEQDLMPFVRQQPNHKVLWGAKLRLGIYNMSGADTTKWYNRWWRRMGEPPVVYDTTLTVASSEQLKKVLENKGYLKAEVIADTVYNHKKRKVQVNYNIIPGEPHRVRSIQYRLPEDTMGRLILNDTMRFPVKQGSLLDRNLLDLQRDLIVTRMRNHGYYTFTKDFIRFNADTTSGSHDVDLTMSVNPPNGMFSDPNARYYSNYIVRKVIFITNYNPASLTEPWNLNPDEIVAYKDLEIWYGSKKYLRPSVLYDACFIRAGEPYKERSVNRTYQALQRMSILNFINIRFLPVGSIGDEGLLDCYIMLTPGRSQSFSVELEGTNSEGDLGVAVGLSYSHRNVGRGAETMTAKIRGAYESVSGNLEGLIHNRFMEYSVDLGINFPKFKAPFLKDEFKRHVNATTEFNVSLSYQERPEYTRIVSTAGWSYKWTERRSRSRHIYTPIDINYVYLPKSTDDFIDQIAPDNPLLRYSYEDHFIMRMGYSFYHTNKAAAPVYGTPNPLAQRNIYTIRVNTEIAGNLLFAINSIFTHRSDFHTNPYKIFGIRYSQYVKAEADYALTHFFSHRLSMAFHAGGGIGVPYGNSRILPFEKRFYGGGANGVRGWSVRTLGPGCYPGTNSVSDFINQCGDIRLDLSVEFRAKLFWIIEGAAFVDAGNIWTIHDYENQPGGMFRFNTFYKQIAAAYGIGLRLDFSYFLLRFDMGMKAHNPALGAEAWPLLHPKWRRDSSFHFSIGYPF